MRAPVFSSRWLLVLGLVAGATTVRALPKPDEPVDPDKRAPISTAGAVKPAATPAQGDGVVGGRVIRMAEVPIRRATADGNRAAVDVRETRKKDKVIKPEARTKNVRKFETSRAADRPAAIPRIDPERFRRMLREYEDGRVPAAEMIASEIKVGEKSVDLAEINRFASPRAALEAQGIPVTPAGADQPVPADSVPVPISEEKNGGSATTVPPAAAP